MGEGSSIQTVPAGQSAAFSSHNDDIVAVLLVAMITAIIVCAGILRFVIRRELGKRRTLAKPESPYLSASLFEGPSRWLAVRSQNPQLIQNALGVQHARACSWSDALATQFEPRLFISPPVNGWIVVMGCDLPDPSDDVDECYKFLAGLSQKLGEVQFFTRNRAISHHGWVRMDSGKVLRAYVWAGETVWTQGSPTDAERDLKMRCLPYAQSTEVLGYAGRDVLSLNTERVVRLAAAWSLDPTSVEGADLEGKGIAGDLLHGRYH